MPSLAEQKKKSRPSPMDALRLFHRADLRAAFLVSLIALPLSLGVAKASGAPPVAGLITAVVGGLVASHLGSAALTIKGPAAGLIAIVLGAVTELTPDDGDAFVGYRRMLAVGVISALVQLVFALTKTGKLSDLFPSSVIHGMLAAIGVIILAKQIYPVFGITGSATAPIPLLYSFPSALPSLNPAIALIGVTSLVLMLLWPRLATTRIGFIPGQIVVVGLGIGLALAFSISETHSYVFAGGEYALGPSMLVELPKNLANAIVTPDFSQLGSPITWRYVVMLSLIGSIESLASAKAVDALDPGNDRSNLDADLFAVGIGNLVSAMLGGLPMISEIVRSSANIESGAKSSWSNFFHGAFLLLAVAFIPALLVLIPNACLGALLVVTGLRLASPTWFRKTYAIGREQLAIFLATLVTTLATDLLVGVAVGIVLKLALHLARGVSPRELVRLEAEVIVEGDETRIVVEGAAIFSNFLSLRKKMLDARTPHVVVDLSRTSFVDHTTLERLDELREDLGTNHRELAIIGLDDHRPASAHQFAARRRLEVQASA